MQSAIVVVKITANSTSLGGMPRFAGRKREFQGEQLLEQLLVTFQRCIIDLLCALNANADCVLLIMY